MARLYRFAPLALIAALACEKPGVAAGLDENTCDGGPCDAPGVISGSLVYSGPARGDAILLLFDTQSLPPPDGTGQSAAAVARIPATTLFAAAAAGSIGPFSAPYVFTQVPSGRSYQVRAFLDVTSSFDPSFDFTRQPRAGAPVGGYGVLVAGQPRLVAIPVQAGQVVSGLNVALTQVLPYDPPSFVIAGGSQTIDQNIDRPVHLALRTTQLAVPGATFARARFAVEPDPDTTARTPALDGLTDVFPRVFLRQVKQFDAASQPVAIAAADAAIIPCRANATRVFPSILQLAPGAAPVAQDQLDVLVLPLAVNAQTLQPLAQIPRGVYQVVVVEKSGQVWTLPNQLGDASRAGSAYYDATQAQAVTVLPAATLPANSVSGTVSFSAPAARNVIVQAYRDDPTNPPPPVGAALPVRLQILRAPQLQQSGTTFSATYRIGGLPAGNYIVEALADLDANFSPLLLQQTPTKGDLVGAVLDSATMRPASIAVSGDVTGQNVTFGPPVPLDPPAFAIDPATPAQMPADQVTPVRFDLRAQALSFPAGSVAAPHFAVQLVRDMGGAAVDADHDGLPDVWPRVFLIRLDPSDPTGLSQYLSPDPQKAHTQVIPAAVDPTPFVTALRPQPGAGVAPVITDRVTVIVRPTLLDFSTPFTAPVRMPLQPGAYKIVLVEQTGQVWQIPNEAGSAALDPSVVCAASASSCAPGTVKTQSQSQAFQVGPPRALYAGAIAGTLAASSTPAAAYVFAYSTLALPPFGRPMSADVHLGAEFAGGAVSFTLPNLMTGDYVVTALADTRGDLAASPALFALAPGAGTLLAAPQTVHVGTALVSGVSLSASNVAPQRPSFQVVDAGGTPLTNDANVTFGATTTQPLRLAPAAVLSSAVSALRPDTAGFFVLTCDGTGKPVAASLTVQLIKISDAAGITPDVDPSTGKGTAVPAAVDQTQFSSATCTPGGVQAVTGPITVNLTNGSSSVNLLNPSDPGTAKPLVPGRYAVVVTSLAKQVWRVPNELQPALLDAGAFLATDPAVKPLLQSQQVAVNIAP
jgi:hypothetical protein